MITSKAFLVPGILFFCLLASPVHKAQANNLTKETPEAQTCRQYGGRSWVVNFSSGNDKALCFFGEAAIGAEEFADFKWNQIRSESIFAALNSTPSEGGASTCSGHRAQYVLAKDSDQRTWGLCLFSDGSAVETGTLASGSSFAGNAGLISALR